MNTEEEIWKPIKGHEGCYSVSNLGNVRNDKNKRIIYGDVSGIGYRRVALNRPEKKRYFVHRLVAEHFVEKGSYKDFEEELVVRHKNGVRTDNRAENLEWVIRGEREFPVRKRYSEDDEEYEIKPEVYYQVFNIANGELIKEYDSQKALRADYPMCQITLVTSCRRGWFYGDWQQKRRRLGIRKLTR